MDFNIDELLNKYLEPLKNGTGAADVAEKEAVTGKAAAVTVEKRGETPADEVTSTERREPLFAPEHETAAAVSKPEKVDFVPEPEAEAIPAQKKIETAPEPKKAVAVREPEKSIFAAESEKDEDDSEDPEPLSDFLKDIFASSPMPEREPVKAEAETIPETVIEEPEIVAEILPEKKHPVFQEIGAESETVSREPDLPDFEADFEHDDFNAEKKRKPSLLDKILSRRNKQPYQTDEADDFSGFPVRGGVIPADEPPQNSGEYDAPEVSLRDKTSAEIKDDFPEDKKAEPDYKVFEPEKYAAAADDDVEPYDMARFRKSAKEPEKSYDSAVNGEFEKSGEPKEERTSAIKDLKGLSEKPAGDKVGENRFRRQAKPSTIPNKTDFANNALSRFGDAEVKREKSPENEHENRSEFIDRTALIGSLFSKFEKVERDAEADEEEAARKPEKEPLHTENEQRTAVFTPDPVPSHMTEPAERAGIEAEKNQVRVFHTGELQPLHEFSGRGMSNRVSITGDFPMKEEIAEPLEGQMSFFEFPEQEALDQIDEEKIEQDVKYRRLEKVKNFRLVKEFEEMDSESGDLYNHRDDVVSDEEPGEENFSGNIPEYALESDRRKIGWFLLKERRKKIITIAILSFITFCFILLELLPRFSGAVKTAIGPGTFANSLISFILVTLAAIASVENVVAGMDSILIKRHPDGRSVGLIALILAIIQSVVSMFAPNDGKTGLLAGSVAFVLLVNAIAAGFEHERIMRNFKFCAYTGKKSLSSLVTVSGEQERREFGQALSMDDPIVKYSCKVNFPGRFIELSSKNRVTDKNCLVLLIGTLVIGSILSALCGIRCGAYYALSGITAAFCAAIPVAEYFSVTNELKRSCENLNKSGGMISSLNAAQKCSETNAVIIDAAELIDKESCEMHGMKDFKNVRLDDILLYTAALVIKSESPLSEVFKGVVMDTEEVLPTVSSISFEENLGVSGWIHGQKVLWGNRNLMAAHNISVPTHREEATYCTNDRKVLYVAIADKLAAMFVVSYAVDMRKAAYLHYLERNNITVLIDSCDPNVSEELLEAEFGLEYGSIKIISSIAGRIFRRLKENFYKKADATVMHDGKSDSLLMSIATAASLRNSARFISIAQLVVAALTLIVMVALAISSRFMFINAWFIVLINVISIAVFSLIGRLLRVK